MIIDSISEVFLIARKGKMLIEKVNSSFLQEVMTLKIYKPETFSPLYKYHICIMQDGDNYFQIGRVATLSDKLHETGKITNTIFVGIHFIDKHDRREKYHPNGIQQQAYIKFLIHEVVPLLDEILPTYHMGQSRALLGDSLAGTLALMVALKYPNTFGKVIIQSPYVNKKVLQSVKDTKNLDSIDIYHSIGTEETKVRTKEGLVDFVKINRQLNSLLLKRNTNYMYHEIPHGDHTWKNWQGDLPLALESVLK